MLSIKLSKTSDDVPLGSARYSGTNRGSSRSVVIVTTGGDDELSSVEVERLRECSRGYAGCIKGYIEGVSTKGSSDVIDKCRVRPLDWARAEGASA